MSKVEIVLKDNPVYPDGSRTFQSGDIITIDECAYRIEQVIETDLTRFYIEPFAIGAEDDANL